MHKKNASKNLPEPSHAIDDADDAELTMAMMDITAPDETFQNNEYQQYKLNQGATNISAGKENCLKNQDENGKDSTMGESWGRDSDNKNVNKYASLAYSKHSSDDINSEQIVNRLDNPEQNVHTTSSLQNNGELVQTGSPALNNRKTLSLKSAYNSDTDVSPVIPIQSEVSEGVNLSPCYLVNHSFLPNG